MPIRSPSRANYVQVASNRWQDPETGSDYRVLARRVLPAFTPVGSALNSNLFLQANFEQNINVCLANGSRHLVGKMLVRSIVPRTILQTPGTSVVVHPRVSPAGNTLTWSNVDYIDTVNEMINAFIARAVLLA